MVYVVNRSEVKNKVEDESSDEDVSRFRRRQIVSNWNRYEDLSSDSEDEPILRGEDFSKILAQTGGSSAQFRFKDEEDWDEERDTTVMLALDLDDLSQSLACIPLHQRLGIEDNLFLNEQTAEFISEASKYKDKYTQNRNNVNKPVRKVTKTKSARVGRERKKPGAKKNMSSGVASNAENIADKQGANTSKQNEDKCSESSITKTKDVLDLEDDLDALLEQADSLSITTRIPMMEAYRLATSKKPDTSTEPTGAVQPVNPNNATQSHEQQSTAGSGIGDFEDMLDALLDD